MEVSTNCVPSVLHSPPQWLGPDTLSVLWRTNDYCVLFSKIKIESFISLNTISYVIVMHSENLFHNYSDSKRIFVVGTDPWGKSWDIFKGLWNWSVHLSLVQIREGIQEANLENNFEASKFKVHIFCWCIFVEPSVGQLWRKIWRSKDSKYDQWTYWRSSTTLPRLSMHII